MPCSSLEVCLLLDETDILISFLNLMMETAISPGTYLKFHQNTHRPIP